MIGRCRAGVGPFKTANVIRTQWTRQLEQHEYRYTARRASEHKLVRRGDRVQRVLRDCMRSHVFLVLGSEPSVAAGVPDVGDVTGDELRRLARLAEPSDFHRELWQWQRELDASDCDLVVFTGNVDDLLERAGFPPDSVRHLHGQAWTMRCLEKDCGHTWEVGMDFVHEATTRCPMPWCRSLRCATGVGRPAGGDRDWRLGHGVRDALVVCGGVDGGLDLKAALAVRELGGSRDPVLRLYVGSGPLPFDLRDAFDVAREEAQWWETGAFRRIRDAVTAFVADRRREQNRRYEEFRTARGQRRTAEGGDDNI